MAAVACETRLMTGIAAYDPNAFTTAKTAGAPPAPPLAAQAVNATGNADIDGVLWGYKWSSANLTYSFPLSAGDYTGYSQIIGFKPLSAVQMAAARADLLAFSSVCGLVLTESAGAAGNLRFGNCIQYDSSANGSDLHVPGGGTADSNPPDPSIARAGWGDSWFSYAVPLTGNDNSNPLLGNFIYTAAFMHELGHNVGLKHGHAAQDGHGVLFPELPAGHNSQEYSIMTYNTFAGAGLTNGGTDQYPETPMQDDIAALQYLYGANYTTHSGNTFYRWSATTGEMSVSENGGAFVAQGVPAQNHILETIWDGGGNDTYDFSNYATNINANLNPGEWINLGSQLADLDAASAPGTHLARGNIANAQLFQGNTASLIENIIAGSGNDTITGNAADNVITGGGGNDSIDGGGGVNTSVYSAAQRGATLKRNANGSVTATTSADGTDTLVNIQWARFADGSVWTGAATVLATPYSALQAEFDQAFLAGGTARIAISDTDANITLRKPAIKALRLAGHVASQTRTNVTGQNYTSATDSYNLDGTLHERALHGVTGQNYSDSDQIFTAGGALAVAKISGIAGQGYTGREDDYSGGRIAKTILSGVIGQNYTGLEYDYDAAGRLAASKLLGVTGQGYTGVEYDFDASGVHTATKLTGIAGANYTTIEYDYDAQGHATASKLLGITGQSYSQLDYLYNAAGQFFADVIHNIDGSALIKAEIAGQNIAGTSGNDTIYSFGNGDVFVEHGATGRDTIVNFAAGSGAGRNVLSLSAGVFADFNLFFASNVVQSGGDTVITLDAADSITLAGIAKSTLSGANFVLN